MLIAGGAILGVVAAALIHTGSLARTVTGMTGLVALGAVAHGASRAWLPAVAWTLVSLWLAPPLAPPPSERAYLRVLTWMVQPSNTTAATVTAILLGVAGTLSYAVLGPRPRAPA